MPTIKDISINIKEKKSLSQLPQPRAWEEDRLRDVRFLDRINYPDEECLDEIEGEGNMFGNLKSYDLIVGEGHNIQNPRPHHPRPPEPTGK
jgi:hypothetical protein